MGIASGRVWQLGARVTSALCSAPIRMMLDLHGSLFGHRGEWVLGPQGAADTVGMLPVCSPWA